ncbi:hypothetical protein PP178_04180 [Zeaxanthinibacter sp. PT1]|uniref:hypothetical protein n=1 Tax=Zeaxanthinibacter TaxID=561554 RepID=UPI002349EE9C|nr:hypothetical protein [Zeaxanthinibacter sp. PT1]MDC6350739.1 hypothetical protein [Zeaxanthinibacter sp. PT1]
MTDNQTWDESTNDFVETPNKLKRFLNDIDRLCKKYGYSISHEDTHGAFIVEPYDSGNIEWLKDAHMNLPKQVKKDLDPLDPWDECDATEIDIY